MTDLSVRLPCDLNKQLYSPLGLKSSASWSEIDTYIHFVSRREQRCSCPCSLISSRNCSSLSDKLWCKRNITQYSWIQCLRVKGGNDSRVTQTDHIVSTVCVCVCCADLMKWHILWHSAGCSLSSAILNVRVSVKELLLLMGDYDEKNQDIRTLLPVCVSIYSSSEFGGQVCFQ